MRRYLFICILVIFGSISTSYADTSSTAGFIPGQIWYSQDSLVEGETVKIYTALWNGEATSLVAHVEFYDGKTLLGARDVTVPPSEIQDVSISWKVTVGDHAILAKISSSSTTISGKKQELMLDNNKTEENKTFVQAKAASTDVIKEGIDKATDTVKGIIPTSVPAPIAQSFGSIDSVRATTYADISHTKAETQKRIDALNGVTKVTTAPIDALPKSTTSKKNTTVKNPKKAEQSPSKPLDATEKPIAYVKLFLFSILAFIFGYKLVFYGLIALILFFILRFIYRKIRRK